MKLSIITICYNEIDVEKTCESIVNQTWQDFEWIVIDGGSQDWCLEILEKYKSSMTYFISEKDKGIYDAMNKGVLQAKGEYLNFMNAGDCFYDDTVLDDVFGKNSFKADIIYGKELRIEENGATCVVGEPFNFGDLYFWNYGYWLRHQASFIKKELFDKYGLYDLKYRSASDFEMFFRFLHMKKCSSVFIDRIIDRFKLFGGISSEQGDIGQKECKDILEYYKACMVNPNDYSRKYCLFGVPFLRVAYNSNIKRVNVLGIPLFKSVKDGTYKRVFVLGFLGVYKAKIKRHPSSFSIQKYRLLSHITRGKMQRKYREKYVSNKQYLKPKPLDLLSEKLDNALSKLNELDNVLSKLNELDNVLSKLNELDSVQAKLSALDYIASKVNQLSEVQLKSQVVLAKHIDATLKKGELVVPYKKSEIISESGKKVIIIPVHQETLSLAEKASLVQCLKVLHKYDIVLIVPESLDVKTFENIASGYGKNLGIKRYSDDYFESTKSYSKLLVCSYFYEEFLEYDYMLIYQLDAWVFSDELEYWCAHRYDYIGAPWFENFDKAEEGSSFYVVAGNGGFSLRKISAIIKLLQSDWSYCLSLTDTKFGHLSINCDSGGNSVEKVFSETMTNEDLLFAEVGPVLDSAFNVASPHVALSFSFEANPRLLYSLNNNKLPFGCHAFKKYDWDFWGNFIDLNK